MLYSEHTNIDLIIFLVILCWYSIVRMQNLAAVVHLVSCLNLQRREGTDSTNPQLLTIDGGDVVGEVGAGCGSASLHEQFPIGAAMAGHQVVVLGRAGPWWRWGKPKEPAFFQMLVGHWEGEEPQRGERLRVREGGILKFKSSSLNTFPFSFPATQDMPDHRI